MFGRKKSKAEQESVVNTTSKSSVPRYDCCQVKAVKTTSGQWRLSCGLMLPVGDIPLAEFKVATPDGDGLLVFTAMRVYVVVRRQGIHIFLDYGMVDDIKIVNSANITLHWSEKSVNHYDYTVKMLDRRPRDVLRMALSICTLHDAKYVEISAQERNAIRAIRVEVQRQKIKELEDELYELRKKMNALVDELSVGEGTSTQKQHAYVAEGGKIMQRVAEIQSVMPTERENLYFMAFDTVQRSPIIPKHVDNKDVWYDVYYDAEHDAFVRMANFALFYEGAKKLRKEMNMPYGCGSTPYPAKDVRFVSGQPATVTSSQTCKTGVTVWTILPRMGVENYHYKRVMGGMPRQSYTNHYVAYPNSHGYNSAPKEGLQLLIRLGMLQKWHTGMSSFDELISEETYLAQEGNKHFNSLVLNDTSYSDDEFITMSPEPGSNRIRNELFLEPFER